jgi:hypothetical protein
MNIRKNESNSDKMTVLNISTQAGRQFQSNLKEKNNNQAKHDEG